MANDKDGFKACVAFRAQVARKVRHHAMEQFVDIGWLQQGFIWGLPEVGARLIELFTASAVIEPVHPRAVRSFLRGMAEQSQDEIFGF